MKTREQAEQRANELFPKVEGNDHLWTSRVVVEREIKAFLQCWDEMQVRINLQEAKDRAFELYPIYPEFDFDRLKPLRDAYLQGWDDSQVAMDAKQAEANSGSQKTG